MGQVEMTKRWEMSTDRFPTILSKRPQDIGIGFEWEVPLYEGCYELTQDEEHFEWDHDCRLDKFSQEFAYRYGFYTHGECNATEFCSPVAYNLQTIKAVARKLIHRVSRDRLLDVQYPEIQGIHVHTSVKGGVTEELFKKVTLLLNRESSAEFIWDFSGRDVDAEDYAHQAESSCWDNRYGISEGETDRALEFSRRRCITKLNQPGSQPTVEYRMWNATPDRLLPALEFSHACTKFCKQHKGDDIPYLKDMESWMLKQSGYKLLKQQPEWATVN